jgi:hypothetical protein
MSLPVRLPLLTIASLLFVACSSSNNNTVDQGSAQTAALTTVSNALTSLSALGNAGGLQTSSTVNAPVFGFDTSEICDENSVPVPNEDTKEWGFKKVLCAVAHNSGSPDSALGALSIMRSVICMLEENGLTYSEQGAEITLTDAPFTTSCFSQEMIDGMQEDGMESLSGTATGFSFANTSGWDSRIQMTSEAFNFDMYFRNSGNIVAASFSEDDGGVESYWTVTLDSRNTSGAALIYESAGQYRHIRVMAEGSLGSNGSFQSFSNLAGIVAEVGGPSFGSIRGNGTSGVVTEWINGGGDKTDCLDIDDNGADCVGVDGLTFVEADSAAFTDGAAVSALGDLVTTNPIRIESVDDFTKAITIEAAFDSTLR